MGIPGIASSYRVRSDQVTTLSDLTRAIGQPKRQPAARFPAAYKQHFQPLGFIRRALVEPWVRGR